MLGLPTRHRDELSIKGDCDAAGFGPGVGVRRVNRKFSDRTEFWRPTAIRDLLSAREGARSFYSELPFSDGLGSADLASGPACAESVVAYSTAWLPEIARQSGLELFPPVRMAYWMGRESAYSGQDILIHEKWNYRLRCISRLRFTPYPNFDLPARADLGCYPLDLAGNGEAESSTRSSSRGNLQGQVGTMRRCFSGRSRIERCAGSPLRH